MVNKRVILIILDGVGVGAMEDAAYYNDEMANTLANLLSATSVSLPYLNSLGLLKTLNPENEPISPLAAYGTMKMKSPGKDTTTGHFELMGLILNKPAPTFPAGFPLRLIQEFEKSIGRQTLGNKPASGTQIILELGQQHLETGYPIIYTSADSVFQIAAHENVIELPELYRFCEIARQLLRGEWEVERVIARPFVGEFPNFLRTANRRDFNLPPPGETALDLLSQAQLETLVVGKIGDIFSLKGIQKEVRSKNNADGLNKIISSLDQMRHGLLFANLNDFDTLYGHRRNPDEFARALSEFDSFLPLLLKNMKNTDLLLITADHGCDPTYKKHTDHTREKVPLLAYSPLKSSGVYLGERETLADTSKTILEFFQIDNQFPGKSFLPELNLPPGIK